MPIERQSISVSQLCELLAIDPQRFRNIEVRHRPSTTITILVEPEADMAQGSGTFPQLTQGGKKIGGGKKSGGKRKGGC